MSTKVSSNKVSRSDGKVSKTAILDATLLIIKQDGLRDVKYQTVAEKAGVANSAVAYYFGDIENLIKQSFLHYFEKYKEMMTQVRGLGEYAMSLVDGDDYEEPETRAALIESYSQALIHLLATKSPEALEFLLLDRIFRNATLTNKSLYRILKVQDQLDIDAIEQVFIKLNTHHPKHDATQFMSLLWFLSEKLVQEDFSAEQRHYSETQIVYALDGILPKA